MPKPGQMALEWKEILHSAREREKEKDSGARRKIVSFRLSQCKWGGSRRKTMTKPKNVSGKKKSIKEQ